MSCQFSSCFKVNDILNFKSHGINKWNQPYLTTTRKSEQVKGVSHESLTSLALTSSKTLSKVIWFGTWPFLSTYRKPTLVPECHTSSSPTSIFRWGYLLLSQEISQFLSYTHTWQGWRLVSRNNCDFVFLTVFQGQNPGNHVEIYIYCVSNLSQRYDLLASQVPSLHVKLEVLMARMLVFPKTDL